MPKEKKIHTSDIFTVLFGSVYLAGTFFIWALFPIGWVIITVFSVYALVAIALSFKNKNTLPIKTATIVYSMVNYLYFRFWGYPGYELAPALYVIGRFSLFFLCFTAITYAINCFRKYKARLGKAEPKKSVRESRASHNKSPGLLFLGILLSTGVGLYLYFATLNGRVLSIVFVIITVTLAVLSLGLKKTWPLVAINSIYGLSILLYFLFTVSSTSEIMTSSGCLDICIGEALVFHLVKVCAVLPIFFSVYLVLRLLSEKRVIKPLLYRIVTITTILVAVFVFFLFLVTF